MNWQDFFLPFLFLKKNIHVNLSYQNLKIFSLFTNPGDKWNYETVFFSLFIFTFWRTLTNCSRANTVLRITFYLYNTQNFIFPTQYSELHFFFLSKTVNIHEILREQLWPFFIHDWKKQFLYFYAEQGNFLQC